MDYRTAVATGHPVAFVLTANDPYFFLDLDKCHDGTDWEPAAREVVGRFPGAAMEVSQSGRGLHILGRCSGDWSGHRNKWDGWLEFYTAGRIVCFGHGWQGNPDIDWTPQLRSFVPARATVDALPQPAGAVEVATDADVLGRMLKARSVNATFGQGASAADLWEARMEVLARFYPSASNDAFDRSSADAALMSHLAFWTGRNPVQMDRLFRQSGLMRAKYEQREDYRTATVNHAIAGTSKVADWRLSEPSTGGEVAIGSGYMSAADQAAHFDGCVYVTDRHAVLVPTGEILRPEQFNARYGGYAFGLDSLNNKTTRKAFEVFTESQARRFPKVARSTFRPERPFGEIVDDTVNTYRKYGVEPVAGDVGPFLRHLEHLLPNLDDRNHMVRWLAYVVKNPGRLTRWAPVLIGPPGNGKSFVAGCVVKAIGDVYRHTVKPKELTATHNGWIHRKLFAQVEEINMFARREIMEDIKTYITDENINVRAMNTDSVTIRNSLNWFFCTNHEDGVIKTVDDRRFAIFQTTPTVPTKEYFESLYNWAEAGGYGHIAHWLLEQRCDDLPATAPRTSSTDAAIIASRGPIEQHVAEAVEAGEIGFRGGWVSAWAVGQLFVGSKQPGPNAVARAMKALGYVTDGRATRYILQEGNKKPKLYRLPDTPGGCEAYMIAQGYSFEPAIRTQGQNVRALRPV